MLATVTSVTGLANVRQKLWDSFNSREVEDDTIDLPEFGKISAIEANIAKASFKTGADKLAGVRGQHPGISGQPHGRRTIGFNGGSGRGSRRHINSSY